jgi:DNA mismatch endonuclease (patch repair protein)
MKRKSDSRDDMRNGRAAERTDVLTPAQRSHCMSRIRGRDTKPELLLRKTLWAMGLRYRVRSKVPGRPDILFPRWKVAVFVDGCQWHCCPLHWVRPKSNSEFWDRKFEENRRRDKHVNRLLKKQGWRVFRFWEHEVEGDLTAIAKKIAMTCVTDLKG